METNHNMESEREGVAIFARKSINGISQKMLLEHLKELSEFKIVGKNTFSGYPLKVEYYLTKRGRDLLDAIVIFQRIGTNIRAELEE
jgi:DNA-binding HxlR family transcriptional regulator